MCVGGLRPSTAHCISKHNTLPAMPRSREAGWGGEGRTPGAPRRRKRRHSAVSTIYSLLGYLVHGVHTANTTQAPQGRQRPGLQSYGRAGAPPGLPSCPPRGLPSSPHGAPGQRGPRLAAHRARRSRSPHSICGHPAGRSPLPLPAWRLPWVAGVEAGCERWRGGGRGGGRGRWAARPGLSMRGWPRRGTARRPPSRPRCPRTCPALPARSPVGEGKWSRWGVTQGPQVTGDTACRVPQLSRAQGCGPWHLSIPYGNTALTVPHRDSTVSLP